jgi:hypothetical protein
VAFPPSPISSRLRSFGPSGPRAYLPLSGRIASAFFPFLWVVLLAGFRLVWFVLAWPYRSSYVLWGDNTWGNSVSS